MGSKLIDCDVCVVGGGAAGIAAVSTLASKGLRVICIEPKPFPGGNATAGAVGTVCGLYPRGGCELLDSPFLETFVGRLKKLANTNPITYSDELYFLPYDVPSFVKCSLESISSPLVQFVGSGSVFQVNSSGDQITEVKVCSPEGVSSVSAKAFIDASGDAIVSRHGGIPCLPSESHQAAAMVFGIEGVPCASERTLAILIMKTLEDAHQKGILREEERLISLVPGSLRKFSLTCKLSLPYEGELTPSLRNTLEREARNCIPKIVDVLKMDPDWSDVRLSWVAHSVGIRSGNRGAGQTVLTESDVVDAIHHPDEVARGVWPIEIWSARRSPEMKFLPLGDYYSIRRGSLISSSVSNLLFAGRTISATERALGSARVIGTAFLTGEASALLAVDIVSQSE
jgi:hypothetical protein